MTDLNKTTQAPQKSRAEVLFNLILDVLFRVACIAAGLAIAHWLLSK